MPIWDEKTKDWNANGNEIGCRRIRRERRKKIGKMWEHEEIAIMRWKFKNVIESVEKDL
jgi:hypothetical protein